MWQLDHLDCVQSTSTTPTPRCGVSPSPGIDGTTNTNTSDHLQCQQRSLYHDVPAQYVHYQHKRQPHLYQQRQLSPLEHMHFPPPPAYQPTSTINIMSSNIETVIIEDLAIAGPSSIDYSYAYYEPGPVRKHNSVAQKLKEGIRGSQVIHGPHGQATYREGSYRSKHTYLTRYGTEENIYEEISDIARARLLQSTSSSAASHSLCDQEQTQHLEQHYEQQQREQHVSSLLSIQQSLVEEEVRRVQTGHKRVLDQLNLSVEAMLMPSSGSSTDGSNRNSGEGGSMERDVDTVTDLLRIVAPTDDLLSPVPQTHGHHPITTHDMDSGFSGSSSGASYRSVAGSLRRGCNSNTGGAVAAQRRPASATPMLLPQHRSSTRVASSQCLRGSDDVCSGGSYVGLSGSAIGRQTIVNSSGKGFWGRKAWRKLGFSSSSTSLNKLRNKDDQRCRTIDPSCWQAAPPDQPQVGTGSSGVSAATLAIVHRRQGQNKADAACLAQSHSSSQRSSEDSWCSTASDPEIGTSDDEDDDLAGLEDIDYRSDRSIASSNQRSPNINQQPKTTSFSHKAKRHMWQRSNTADNKPTNSTNNINQSPTPLVKMRHSLESSPLQSNVSDVTASPPNASSTQSRLSRWFSMRRASAHQYDVDSATVAAAAGGVSVASSADGKLMPLLPEVEEEMLLASGGTVQLQQRRQLPPTLPPPPTDLTAQQQKRRLIIQAIVHSENSYVATLHRLVNDYKKLLEESSPAILSNSKISTLFYRLPEILQCHTLFRIALAESVHNWDKDERIGDVFVASFSKAIVLDIYSGFINNFSVAMDLAKMEAKRKSALADFLKVKQISSHDRLSFFGLMVKPVQRFPQFILFLQDLLKHTPQGHHDRMSLQLALTQLESLAEMLNERKRESEQFQAFKETLRHISGKFTARPLSDSNRYLLREDDVTQLEFNQYGLIQKAKSRRLLLLNDLVVCVAVTSKSNHDINSNSNKRLTLKWMYPVADVEIQDISASPTLSRLLTTRSNGNNILNNNNRSAILVDGGTVQQPQADNLCTEMSNLMYDYEVMSRIVDLVGSLRGNYSPITPNLTRSLLHQIQQSIQHKDEEMLWVDSCCLQLLVRSKGGTKEEVFTFQTDNPSVKKDWVTELRLAQLALDPSNSPAWEVPEQESRPSTKMPLFVRAQSLHISQHQSEVRCGCYFTIPITSNSATSRQTNKHQSYLWICTIDGASTHIAILAQHPHHAASLKHIGSFSLLEAQITCIEFVKGASNITLLASDVIVCGTATGKVLFYAADSMDSDELIASCQVNDSAVQIKYLCDCVFVALSNGTLLIFRRHSIEDCSWNLQTFDTLQLGNPTEPVSYLLPINTNLYAACAKKVYVVNALTSEITKSFSIQHEHVGNVNLMAHSGIGLWISLKNSSTICLYHTETFKHLQDINVASNVMRVTNDSVINNNRSNQVNVTALLACKGLLWVGTNVGISLTIPLPRLEGVPIISGRVNISYHAHYGPISFLLALQPRTYYWKPLENTQVQQKQPNSKEETDKLRHHLTNSPIVIRRKSKENDHSKQSSRLSKTLPRGLGGGHKHFSCSTTSSQGSGDTCDVYDLYGKLMYIKDLEQNENCLEDHPVYESLRRSDPELAAIPGKVSTLDRKLRMKVSRPRSLDLSNWSVDSRSSSIYTSTSGSEESLGVRLQQQNATKSVSLNNSFAVNHSTINEEETQSNVTCAKKSNNQRVDKEVNGGAARRTIITLMGGRGYVNWRQPCCNGGDVKEKGKSAAAIAHQRSDTVLSNNNDSHIVIWELKL